MNNKEFLAELSQRSGYMQNDTMKLVRTAIDAISNVFGDNNKLQVPSFGTFEAKKHLERIVVNPSTGQRMMVPPKRVLSFRPVSTIKEQLKKGGSEDE